MAQLGIAKKRGQHVRRRRHPGIPGPRPDLYAAKVKDAQQRQAEWASLSPIEQLAALDRRLGADVGAKKQRARLQLKITLDMSNGTPQKSEIVFDSIATHNEKKKIKAKDRRAADQKRGRK